MKYLQNLVSVHALTLNKKKLLKYLCRIMNKDLQNFIEYREELYNEIIQEFDYLTGYCLTGDEVQTIVSDIVEFTIYKLNTNTHG